MSVYFPNSHTPAEWRQMSQDCHRRSQESWERSDTDGYLSQWASDITGRLYSFLAEVAEKGGEWQFRVLADEHGVEIEGAKEFKSQFGGYSWRLPNGTFFNPSKAQDEARREAADLKKGFRFIWVMKPAVVVLSDGMMPAPYCIPRRSEMVAERV